MKEFLADRKGAVALIVIVVLFVAVIVAAHVSAPERDRQEVELGSVLVPPGGLFPAGGEETSAETVEPDEDRSREEGSASEDSSTSPDEGDSVEPTGASSDLAFTGPDVAGLGIAGLLLAGLGTALVYQGRREKI